MIGRVIDFCARHRWGVIVCFLASLWPAVLAARHVKLDATPDLSDGQVILLTEWPGRSPAAVEDGVTYPLVRSLLSTPRAVDVRGVSMAGMSFVYVLFEEGVEIHWARARILERLAEVRGQLPSGANPTLGPEATGIGWVYQYALVDRSRFPSVARLRAIQETTLRTALETVPGVAQVATVGGEEEQFQIELDPERMRLSGVTADDVFRSVRMANRDPTSRVLDFGGRDYFIRVGGSLDELEPIGAVVVKNGQTGPIRVKDVASIRVASSDTHRGWADFNGGGDTVGAIVVARQG